jgi:small subunit ribosomal protein S1
MRCQRAFEHKEIIAGRVTGAVKGGLTSTWEREPLCRRRAAARVTRPNWKSWSDRKSGCRIIKLDVDEEDVVVDRRSVLEEEAKQIRQNALASLEEGAVVRGTVRSIADYGAFIDIGGVDGLLHVGDISWSRVT